MQIVPEVLRMRTLPALVAALWLLPGAVSAQLPYRPTPPPSRTAVNTTWYQERQSIFVSGDYYYPAGASVFFDANTMVLIGFYDGVPLYADMTLEPHSIVLVPVARGLMQPYERRREGYLVGTVGSRPPSFPVRRDVEASVGNVPAEPSPTLGTPSRVSTEPVAPAVVGEPGGPVWTAIPPSGSAGVWVEFGGARWTSQGHAVPFVPTLFERVGEYRGFPVYRSREGAGEVIYIPSRDNLVAPYRREQPDR
jgi:hypothetical protein